MAVPYQATSLEQRRSLRSPPSSLDTPADLIITCPEDSQRRMVRWLVEEYQLTVLGSSQGHLFLQLSPTMTEAETIHPLLPHYAPAWQLVQYPASHLITAAEKARLQRLALLTRRLCDDQLIAVIGALIRLYPVTHCITQTDFGALVLESFPDTTAVKLRLSASPRALEQYAGNLLVDDLTLTPSLAACTHFVTLVQLTAEPLQEDASAKRKQPSGPAIVAAHGDHRWFVGMVAKEWFQDYFDWKERLHTKVYNTGVGLCWHALPRRRHTCSQSSCDSSSSTPDNTCGYFRNRWVGSRPRELSTR